ncbi:MAG: hypothetical protein M3Z24_02870 [Chloroflexota bacterium]|nr:hypothetical protein [Chloroflexota bacterium]
MFNSTETTKPIQNQPQGVLLVGSVPLDNTEEVFRTTSSILAGRLRRIPDGETGERSNWIGWQARFLASNPLFEMIPPNPNDYAPLPHFKLRSPMSSREITFDTLGYADAAKASYAVFSQLKQGGLLPANARFQVSLPTPLAPVTAFVVPEDQAVVEPAYEAAMLAELDQITTAIPHDDLAIQWDVAIEFGILEGMMPTFFSDAKAEILERLIRLGNRVPSEVEMGYHLCYGDAGHKHFKEPEDAAKLVEVANAISAGVKREINWIHMPVPHNRTDDAYFAPLRNLKLHPETELYLGLVHFTDGVEGTQRRIAAAQRVVAEFGVATECGMGRRSAETIPDLLRIHSEVAAPV